MRPSPSSDKLLPNHEQLRQARMQQKLRQIYSRHSSMAEQLAAQMVHQNSKVESRIEKHKRASSLLAASEVKGQYIGKKARENFNFLAR